MIKCRYERGGCIEQASNMEQNYIGDVHQRGEPLEGRRVDHADKGRRMEPDETGNTSAYIAELT